MKKFEERCPLGNEEDCSTKYELSDWTSACKLRNHIDPLLRIDVGVLRLLDEGTDEIEGYQITVYNINTQVIVYKFYVNCIKDYVWSLNNEEAISVLNKIGFNCRYIEDVELTENARKILESCKIMGYTHISRILGVADYMLTVGETVDEAEYVTGNSLRDLLARTYDHINLYDFRFIGRVPVSIEELLER